VAERDRSLDRLLTFVDAVVAIAITLLVLPLVDVAREARSAEVGALLHDHVDDLVGFLLSFVVIARLWVAQHGIVGSLVRQNDTVVFLPFPTALITATDHDTAARVLYIGTMAVSSALLALIARVIGRDRRLRDTEVGPDTTHAIVMTAAFVAALAISLAIPSATYWPLLLLLFVDPVISLVRAKVRRGRAGRS
jgi:uncharacterized membrane protein